MSRLRRINPKVDDPEFTARRRENAQRLAAASERIGKKIDSENADTYNLSIKHGAIDEAQVHFDWHPVPQNGSIVFQTRITRGSRTSAVDFEVDLSELLQSELQQLSYFLARRYAGLTTGYEVVRAIAWLLDISIAQVHPGLSKADRDIKVRELLLSRAETGV